jgi:hypothetical protein
MQKASPDLQLKVTVQVVLKSMLMLSVSPSLAEGDGETNLKLTPTYTND